MQTPQLPSKALIDASEAAANHARVRAEMQIEKILKGLEHDTMIKIKQVDIDTQNYETPIVNIWFVDTP